MNQYVMLWNGVGVGAMQFAISGAVDGAQVLLSELWPCASGLSSCTGATPLDEAALFVLPPLTNPSQAQLDYTCSRTNP